MTSRKKEVVFVTKHPTFRRVIARIGQLLYFISNYKKTLWEERERERERESERESVCV